MRWSGLFDPFLVFPIIGLIATSLFITGSTAGQSAWTQAAFFILGVILFIFLTLFDHRSLAKMTYKLFVVCLIFLLMTFLGPKVRGSTRWIDVGAFKIQPSELIKPFMIIVFASILSQESVKKLPKYLVPFLLFLPIVSLIFIQPDLGNVLVFTSFFTVLEVMAGLPVLIIAVVSLISLASLPAFWLLLKEYQRYRIFSFINPYADPTGAGYNALQAMIAIGSGRITGLGLGHGTQSKLLFLPEYHTDFVFASLGEELGLLGGALVIGLYLILLGRILFISSNAGDDFSRLLSLGIFTQLFSQVFINIGMNLGILPITGITLPLISIGGSSILSTFIGLGLVASIGGVKKTTPLVIGR